VNKHFYAVKFNAESGDPVTFKGKTYTNPQFDATRTAGRNGTHELTMAIAPANGRVAYPTVVYMDKDLNVLAPVQGFLTPEQIEPIFRYFGEGHYTGKDYATYMQGFVATWQGEP
jgi:thioredoxin-related protein